MLSSIFLIIAGGNGIILVAADVDADPRLYDVWEQRKAIKISGEQNT